MRFLPIFCLLWMVSVSGFSQRQDSSARIFVFRDYQDIERFSGYQIFVNNQQIHRLTAEKGFTYITRPGVNIVYTFDEAGRKSEVVVNLKRGQTACIKGEIFEKDTTYMAHGVKQIHHTSIRLVEVSAEEAEKFKQENPMAAKKIIKPEELIVNRENYFHIDLAGGFNIGFTTYPMFTTNNGNDATISPGGGIGGKLGLGYTFNRVFDLSGTVGFGFSTLSQPLQNAEATFARAIFEATFRYIFIRKNGHRLQLGAGLTRAAAAELDVDGSKLANGGHNIYKYDNANGFHVVGGWKYLFQRYSIGIDLKYIQLQYDLKEATSNGFTIPQSYWGSTGVQKIDGSGLELQFGLGYHF